MVGLQRFRRRRMAALIGLAGLVAGGSVALGQDQAPAKDTIFARKILMDTIGHNMDELDGILGAAKLDLNEGHEHADIISVMLMAFPHLFPPATNQWKAGAERDPGTDTFAAPEAWTNYADFYKRAQDASRFAYKASRADTEAEFKDFVAQLRVGCDSCHAVYMKQE
jgi:cytochrome c556